MSLGHVDVITVFVHLVHIVKQIHQPSLVKHLFVELQVVSIIAIRDQVTCQFRFVGC